MIVYADEFIIPRSVEDEFGVVHEYQELASGEAWDGGPLLISWRDAQMAGSGYNVVIHEFAHKLDMLNGEANGIPPLPAEMLLSRWQETLDTAYDDFCAPGRRGGSQRQETVFDPYASENPGEFFTRPPSAHTALLRAAPPLYAQLPAPPTMPATTPNHPAKPSPINRP